MAIQKTRQTLDKPLQVSFSYSRTQKTDFSFPMIKGTQDPSVGRTTLQTTPNYDDLNSNKDEMDIEEIIERSRDFKCNVKYLVKL